MNGGNKKKEHRQKKTAKKKKTGGGGGENKKLQIEEDQYKGVGVKNLKVKAKPENKNGKKMLRKEGGARKHPQNGEGGTRQVQTEREDNVLGDF